MAQQRRNTRQQQTPRRGRGNQQTVPQQPAPAQQAPNPTGYGYYDQTGQWVPQGPPPQQNFQQQPYAPQQNSGAYNYQYGNQGGQQQEFDNTDRGVLFKNNRKNPGDKKPDYTGTINVGGETFWLSAWMRRSKQGQPYMSLAITAQDQSQHPHQEFGPPQGDDLPF